MVFKFDRKRRHLTINERRVLKTQLVCTFVRKHQIEDTLDEISESFSVLNNRVFLLKSINIHNELILSYNVILDSYKDFLPGSILVHRKTETNTIYTINALNELIMNLNNGILDKKYPIDWQNYKDTMMLKKPDGLKFLNIQTIKVYNL
jgi:hypothetical protein